MLGFTVAYVNWNDRTNVHVQIRAPQKEGTYPDGYYSQNYIEIPYCCRRDGFVANGISLPIGKFMKWSVSILLRFTVLSATLYNLRCNY